MDNYGFLKVAAAVPRVKVGDCAWNASRLAALADEAAQRGVEIVVFPELALTGYTCGDLLLHGSLLDAADEVFGELMRATRKLPLTLIAGIPLRHGSTLYNCAAVFTQGRVLGVVPKSYIPDYSEFYENRWFASGAGISDEQIAVAGQQADFGADLTFEVNGTEFGVELCEDLWAAIPPSSQLALNGAKVIFNLSASPEAVGKHAYLRQLVAQQSARTIAGYFYCSAGFGESSPDLFCAGNGLIAENGRILREMPRFQLDEQLLVADKAISVSNLINGSTRLQPVVLLTGQAAGTLAALAVKAGCTPREVPVRTLQRALLGQKAYIAPTYDVRPDDPDFELLQRIAATGILRLTGEPFHWANRSWFYPEEGITVGEFTRGLKDYAPQIDVEESDKPLTAAAAAALLRRAGGAADTPADGDRPLTRRETARMVEEALHPFDRDIDFEGNLINL